MLLLIREEWARYLDGAQRLCSCSCLLPASQDFGSIAIPAGEPGLGPPDASSWDVVLFVDEHLWTGGTGSLWWDWCFLCLIQKKARKCLYRRPLQKGSFQTKWNVVTCWRVCRILGTYSAGSVGKGVEERVLWALRCSSPQSWLSCSFYSPDLCWEITAQHRSPELFCRSALEACFFPSVCSWVYFPCGVEIIILLVSYVLAPTKRRNVLRFFMLWWFFFFFNPVQFLLLKYSGQQLLPT